jgi:hypothetical protein
MASCLLLAGLALRAGLEMRRARLAGARPQRGVRRRHLRLAKPAVALVLVGFIGGVVSSVLLRGWQPFDRLHGWLGLISTALFFAAFILGRRLERHQGRPVHAHGLLGALAMLFAAVAFAAGFVLLP